MHPSSQVNFERRNQVKRVSALILAVLGLYLTAVMNNFLSTVIGWIFALVIGLMVGSWVYFLGTGKVWEEWFWRKRS